MIAARHRGGWAIAATFFLGLVLTILPLPPGTELWRPEWSALILIYWCVTVPQRVGVGVGWLVGCLQDVLLGTLLGAHGLAYSLVAYGALRLHRRLRILPLWQQALTVVALLLIVKGVLFGVRGITSPAGVDWRFWLPVLSGAALWPLLFAMLTGLRRAYQIQ